MKRKAKPKGPKAEIGFEAFVTAALATGKAPPPKRLSKRLAPKGARKESKVRDGR